MGKKWPIQYEFTSEHLPLISHSCFCTSDACKSYFAINYSWEREIKQEEEEEEQILGLDSGSETSDAEDQDYVPQEQDGVMGESWNPALLNEESSFDGIGDSSDESSEEETQTLCHNLCHWYGQIGIFCFEWASWVELE